MNVASFMVIVLLAFASVAPAQTTQPWKANPEVIAALSKRKPDVLYDEAKVPAYTLPEVLRAADGSTISTPEAWKARRAEILELFRHHMYGQRLPNPDALRFESIEVNEHALDGAATLKRIAIISTFGQREHRFELKLFLPNAITKPAAVFLLINNRSSAENIDTTRVNKSPFWPVEEMIARGFGIAAFQNTELAPDDAKTFRDGIIRVVEGDVTERAGDAPTALGAWAWGASRAMDYFETDKRVDAKHVAVLGHSRGGKTALLAGAEDLRFAMVISNNSGACGAAISRRKYGETIKMTHRNTHWFCDNFRTFHDREETLPFDQHMLIALSAPRAVYVTSSDEDLWADPKGEFLGLANASPVWGLWGQPAIPLDAMPGLDQPLHVGVLAYHVRTGKHDLTLYDWMRFADHADAIWGRGK
jgi:hypothetical protein